MVFLSLILAIAYIISIPVALAVILAFMSGNLDTSASGLVPALCSIPIFIIGTIMLAYEEKERARRTKGRECDVTHLEGIPDFEREQRLHLTLDVEDRIIIMDGQKEKDVPSKHQKYTVTEHLKDTQVRLRFQQITKLNYICWEGDVSRWEPGTMGFSAPGLFKGTRMYVPGTRGYAYTEKLKVDYALEIRYRDQAGSPARIVLKVRSRDDYVDKWLEALCRCTNLPAPQYVPPVKPEKPGPRYL